MNALGSERERPYVVGLEDLGSPDVPLVGGKNASLGEMMKRLEEVGVAVPDGFATTAHAYWDFLDANDLRERIGERLARLARGDDDLATTGSAIRRMMRRADLPAALADGIVGAYTELGRRAGREDVDVAVRSSATAEDLPEASFAGQQETYLNVTGAEALLDACRRCLASLLHGSRDRLSRASWVRAHGGRPLGGCPAHGSLGSRRRGGHVHGRHGDGVPERGAGQRGVRARRVGGRRDGRS